MEPESMTTANPFAPPKAALVADEVLTFDESSAFSAKGRFGRIDFILYSLGIPIIYMACVSAVFGIAAALGFGRVEMSGLLALLFIPILYAFFVFMIRRLHDLNWTGWLSILYFFPIANTILFLLLIFLPGTKGTNNHGPMRKPPSKLKIFLALAVPIAVIVGILAAVAIPAYQDFVLRSQGT